MIHLSVVFWFGCHDGAEFLKMPTIGSSPVRSLFGALALTLLGTVAAAHADTRPLDMKSIAVALDRAKIVKVPEGTQTLIIGNPLVADVTMLKGNGSMVVTGRSFGATNLIWLDSAGNSIGETMVKVSPAEQSMVVLRGLVQESYSCNPRCSPTVALGDDSKYMNDGIANVKSRNGAALAGGK
jgi:hypothetical protein